MHSFVTMKTRVSECMVKVLDGSTKLGDIILPVKRNAEDEKIGENHLADEEYLDVDVPLVAHP